MNACQIIVTVLELEKNVQASILQMHKCAGEGEYSYGDPLVNEFQFN